MPHEKQRVVDITREKTDLELSKHMVIQVVRSMYRKHRIEVGSDMLKVALHLHGKAPFKTIELVLVHSCLSRGSLLGILHYA